MKGKIDVFLLKALNGVYEQASLDLCTGLFLRALHAFRKSAIHLFSYTDFCNKL